MTPKFIHLRLHSAYSLAEGAIKIETLTHLCEENNMPAVAVTDTNNLFGAMEFSKFGIANLKSSKHHFENKQKWIYQKLKTTSKNPITRRRINRT